jgi:putative transcriptional regulator
MWIPKIQEIRKSKGLMQGFVAKECSISQQMLSEYEKAKTYPRAPILFNLAKTLNCKVDDLYEWKED